MVTKLPFDQYQRYSTISEILMLFADNKPLDLLEVGGNEHGNLKKFIPNSNLVILDSLEIHSKIDDVEFIQGNGTNMEFPDDSFDFTISLDVLEHVPSIERDKFLAETFRVARRGVMLSFPSGKIVSEAEKKVNSIWKEAFNDDFIWLKEHFAQGLPNLDDIRNISKQITPFVCMFRHGDLGYWVPMMEMHFLKEISHSLRPLVAKMDYVYNTEISSTDYSKEGYRVFVILLKYEDDYQKLSEIIKNNISLAVEKDKSLFKEIAEFCKNTLKESKKFSIQLAERDAQLAEKDAQLSERDAQLSEKDAQLAERDAQLAEKDAQLSERDAQLAEKDAQLAERDAQLAEKDAQIGQLYAQLAELYSSTSWRITAPIRFIKNQQLKASHFLSLLLRGIALRGGLFKTIIKVLSILSSEGVRGVQRRLHPVKDGHLVKNEIKNPNSYDEWINQYDYISDQNRRNFLKEISTFKIKPLISVLMPVYNPPIEFLEKAIQSVQTQLYSNWELCIADDNSTEPQVKSLLKKYAEEDSRIKVVFRQENGHISQASNSALELVSGDYVALLDHDDTLSEHALFWVAKEINDFPDAKLIYSDEDKIDIDGKRFDPYFKCDWNLDLCLSHNMFCHLGIYKTELMRSIGGFRVGFEGAQDYDILLRSIEKVSHSQICHIPKILYHWRVLPGSTALDADEKPYAMLAGERAINEYLTKNHISAKATLLESNYRVKYDLPSQKPLVSLIIPTRNAVDILKTCIDSIFEKTSYKNYEIIIIDNGSDEPDTLDYLKSVQSDSRVSVIRDARPFNYSALNNAAVKQASGSIIGLLNNDVEVITPDWMEELVSHVCRDEIGAVGAKLLYPDDTIQHAGIILGICGVAGHVFKRMQKNSPKYFGRDNLLQSLSAVTGACLFIRKDVFNEVAGLNEKELTIAFNDVDFCIRIREKGYRNIWTPYAVLYHHESKTRGYEDTPEKQKRFESEVKYMRKKWAKILDNDPAYSSNMTLDKEDFSIAFPPRVKHVL